MEGTRTMSLLITVVFIAVILSGTAYFGITALIASPDSFADTAYYADVPLPKAMHDFDRGFYLDRTMREFLTANDYRLFERIADQRVVLGEEDFLFPLQSSSGYDYLEDFAGNLQYSEEQLEHLAKALTKRRIAYENQGATYILAVIPNVQTVYREYLPWRLGQVDAQTRLEQVSEYLTANEEGIFLDLTDALISAKGEGLLYNNTEDSLNALGAYTVYRTILDKIPSSASGKYKPLAQTEVNFFTRYIPGKELARQSGVSSLIKNKTVSLSNDTELKYQILERVAGTEITYINLAHKNEISNRPVVLLEFSEEWDKILLMPYFSNTFGTVAYKNTPAYSQMTVDRLSPNVVVQFIHESELDELLDESVMLSYNDGLKPGDDPFTAMTPIVLGAAQSAADRVCVVGRCEEGSVIRLSGDGVYPTEVSTQGERFILEARLMEGVDSVAVSLEAIVRGKETGLPETVSLHIDPSQEETGVLVGDNSMLFHAGGAEAVYTAPYTLQQLHRICTRYSERAEEISDKNGKPTQLVYAYIPDKISVYGDSLEKSGETLGRKLRLTQLSEAVSALDGITMLDLTPSLRLARNTGLQYLMTGRGLSPLGAYSTYRAIMLELERFSPALAPLPRSAYVETVETQAGGDLIKQLGLDSASITEQVVALTPKKNGITKTAQDGSSNPQEEELTVYYHTNESLPVALVVRDKAGTPLLDFLAENFSLTYVLAEDDFQITEALLQEIAPDYIFILAGEYALPLN